MRRVSVSGVVDFQCSLAVGLREDALEVQTLLLASPYWASGQAIALPTRAVADRGKDSGVPDHLPFPFNDISLCSYTTFYPLKIIAN